MRPPSIPTTIPINRDDTKQVVIMKSLYNSLIEFRDPKTHRILIQLFMCLPSRKDFPEYFDIIKKPIAMNKIRDRIERQLYADEVSCLEDFKLMFSNCKFFNEDDSQIYRDAVELEASLKRRREQLHIEYNNRPSRDTKDATDRGAILNNNATATTTTTFNTTHNSNNTTTTNATNRVNSVNDATHQDPNNQPLAIKSARFNHTSSNANNNHATSTPNNSSSTATPNNNSSPVNMDHSNDKTISQQQTNNTTRTPENSTNNVGGGSSVSNSTSNHNIISSYHTSHTKANHNSSTNPSTPNKASNGNINNGIASIQETTLTQQSDSTNHSSSDQQNGNNDLDSSNLRINHNHHNDTSMDSSSNLSADLIASTPIEKCSLNTRRGKNSDAPKRQLLTGYIIYASEIRKQVIDKNPNQNFGDISRLVGNEWKALPHDIRSKYDQRALIHNKRVRERAQRDLNSTDRSLTNGLHTPKLTKRKLAKLAKEQMRQHHLSISGHHDESSTQSPRISQERSSSMVSQIPSSNKHHQSHQHSQPQTNPHVASSKHAAVESSTQTTIIRFVEPPARKRLVYSDTFRKYIESLEVPNRDLLAEETTPERPAELPTHWLGSGIGRHESPEAALWALRDFMLQDAVTMRRSMEPYL